MRVGVFGGSFDPVHIGHLWIAEAARERLDLSEVRWVPTSQSPLKPRGAFATEDQRLTMLRLALSGAEGHVIDDREISRGGVSYTVDTMTQLREEMEDPELFMIIGGDSLASIRQWHRPQELLELALPAVVHRGGEKEPDFSVLEGILTQPRLEACREHIIPMPLIEISSSEMRQRIAAGRSIRFRTPRSVEAFLRAEQLYAGTDK